MVFAGRVILEAFRKQVLRSAAAMGQGSVAGLRWPGGFAESRGWLVG